MAIVVFPLFYSMFFPNQDIQQIQRALEGRATLPEPLAPLAQHVTTAVGPLHRAIQVGAYWHTSADYNIKQTHTIKETQLSYLAWFQKRSRPTILVFTRTETDGSQLSFDIDEGSVSATVRAYLLPAIVLAVSVYWFRKRRLLLREDSTLRATGP